MNEFLEQLTKVAEENNIPAYHISVATKDGIETSRFVRANPCQNSYSVAKFFCVTAIGMLYDEGKITPEATIGEIFADELKEYGIDAKECGAGITALLGKGGGKVLLLRADMDALPMQEEA